MSNAKSACLFLFAIGMFHTGCGPETQHGSSVKDIYPEDEATQSVLDPRHRASLSEALWTIEMPGCSGHLLTTNYMMTAAHCKPVVGAKYRSGASLANNKIRDITVEEIAEVNESLDYAILKIKWFNDIKPAEQRMPAYIATTPLDVATSMNENQGDEVFTVGFPGDKIKEWGMTYADGRLKGLRGNSLVFNISVINGNSGGGVWRKTNNMLVSLTNNGPNKLNSGDWNTGNRNDPVHWNSGVAMWKVFEASALVRELFPSGKSSVTVGSDDAVPQAERIAAEKLHVALQKPGDSSDVGVIWVSAPADSSYVTLCLESNRCQLDSPFAFLGKLVGERDGRKIFYFMNNVKLNDHLQVGLQALNARREIIGERAMEFAKKP